jgi:hypothetical protein
MSDATHRCVAVDISKGVAKLRSAGRYLSAAVGARQGSKVTSASSAAWRTSS